MASDRDVIAKRKALLALKKQKQQAQRIKSQQNEMDLTDDEKKLIALVGQLDEHYDGLVIVVEGRSDEIALRTLGIKAPIVKTQSSLARPELIDKIAEIAGDTGQVLVMTDFDHEGRDVSRFVQRELEAHRVKVLGQLRRRISRLMGSRRCIEDLTTLFKSKDLHQT